MYILRKESVRRLDLTVTYQRSSAWCLPFQSLAAAAEEEVRVVERGRRPFSFGLGRYPLNLTSHISLHFLIELVSWFKLLAVIGS